MKTAEVQLCAALRVASRAPARQVRNEALRLLLSGEDVPPQLIEAPERQRCRAELLHLDIPAGKIGQDAAPTRKLYEAVIGRNDTLPRRFLAEGDKAARAIGRIVVQQAGGGVLYGTGALISRHLVITNHHVLESAESATGSAIELGYYEVEDGGSPPDRRVFSLDPSKYFYSSSELDYTVVGVAEGTDGASTSDYGHVELLADSGKALIGERVNIVHHAGGRAQSISIRANEVVDVFDHWLHYAADTEPGSSGGAVFNDEWQIVAIHHASVPVEQGEGVVNEGIRVSAIVQDLMSQNG